MCVGWVTSCLVITLWLPFLFPPDPSGGPSATTPGESAPIRAPASLWRCSRIMHLLRDLHPTLLSALEGIVDQVKKGGEWLASV